MCDPIKPQNNKYALPQIRQAKNSQIQHKKEENAAPVPMSISIEIKDPILCNEDELQNFMEAIDQSLFKYEKDVTKQVKPNLIII